MQLASAALLFCLAQLPAVAAPGASPATELPEIVPDDPGKCVALAEELSPRQVGLDGMRASLEAELATARAELTGGYNALQASLETISKVQATHAGAVADFNSAQQRLQTRMEELKRQARLLDDPPPAQTEAFGAFFESVLANMQALSREIAAAKKIRQQLLHEGQTLDEQIRLQNEAARATDEKVARINERVEAYNAQSTEFAKDVARYKATCAVSTAGNR